MTVAVETIRVAIYTRKSLAEGLEQEFNTLDAQREAVEAYVQSQRGEGWRALPERYDDGGFTGANTDRPAFQRLLEDVQAGKVDVIAVYKLDRLSRSLADFARLMDLLRSRGVDFVSVTQNFDTSNPMGRMVLNLLATFAEFERETIAERTRDKILASRRKGMWTGGRPVLGYDVVEKKLVVNEDEAERVRAIYDLYLDIGTLLGVVDELKARGWKTKTWTNQAGTTVHGRAFTKTSLSSLLKNPLYLGKVRCDDELYEGEHEAIVDQETWDAVAKLLKAKAPRRPRTQKHFALLRGIARCSCGSGMTYTFTTRDQKRWGYYECVRRQKEGAEACPHSRIAVGELDAFVVDQVRSIGRDPEVLEAVLEADRADRETRRPELIAESKQVAGRRSHLLGERKNLVDAIAQSANPELSQQLAGVDEEIKALEERVRELRDELVGLDGDIDPAALQRQLEELEPLWEELFPAERHRLLSLLLEQVVYHAEAGEAELVFRAR